MDDTPLDDTTLLALAVTFTALASVLAFLFFWRREIPKVVSQLPPLTPLPPLPPLPEPTGYTHDATEVIERHGDWAVVGLKVRRAPVMDVLAGVIDAASGGTFSKALHRLSYSSVFHLGIVVELESPQGAEVEVLVEKLEVICVTWPGAANELMGACMPRVGSRGSLVMRAAVTAEYKRVRFVGGSPPPGLTLRRLLGDAELSVAKAGKNWFAYDAFRGQNCQDLVSEILRTLAPASVANLDDVVAFVRQDVEALVKELPPRVARMARAVTDAGAAITGAVDEAKHRIKSGVRQLRQRGTAATSAGAQGQ